MKPARSLQWWWLIFSVIGFVALLCVPVELYARAGGGGGGSSGGGRGGGLIKLAVLFLYWMYAGLLWLLIRQKEKQADRVLAQLAGMELTWGRVFIHDRIREIYFKVQKAWMDRDYGPARDWVSERLLNLHSWKTSEMKAKSEKNIMEQIALNRLQIVEVADYQDDTKDRLWVVVHGSMVDYVVDERTGEVLRGKKNKTQTFQELWKFIRGPKGWVLDEIDEDVEVGDLLDFKSSLEKT